MNLTDNERSYLAPVAQYRGIALVERRGEKRAAWRGVEYLSDGHVHFLKRTESNEKLEIWTLENEKAAKAVIDSMFEPQHPDCGEGDLGFLSVLEVLIVSKAGEEMVNDYLRWRNSGGHWEWDHVQELFIAKSSGGGGS